VVHASIDQDLLLVDRVLAHIQRIGEPEDLGLTGRMRPGGHLDDDFGSELFPGVDVHRIVEFVGARWRLLVRNHVEHPGELEVAAYHAAHDHVRELRRERRQDRELGHVFLGRAGDHELAERVLVRQRGGGLGPPHRRAQEA
jgi:hypothetical protein